MEGHAIELRVCAEDPFQDFLPNIGTVKTYLPPMGPGVRVDDCMESHMEIPIYYDNMLSKLITYGKDRNEAIARMKRAIEEYVITGIQTTLPFGTFVMNHPKFIEGNFSTHFISQYYNHGTSDSVREANEQEDAILTAAAFVWEQGSQKSENTSNQNNSKNRWSIQRKLY